MISSLKGTITDISGAVVIIDVGGVGYEVTCSNRCIEKLELRKEACLVVHTDVREDSIRLFGFEDKLEKHVFLLLTRVKGLGTRSASDIVSKMEKRELLRVIASGDSSALQKLRGVGKKTADRIILELQDKVGEFVIEGSDQAGHVSPREGAHFEEAIEALQALGFSSKDAEAAVARAKRDGALSKAGSGEIVREALRFV